jgi:predicted HAD superfamily Cof-like phosphohydrolase
VPRARMGAVGGMTPGEMVREFHERFGVAVRTEPVADPPESDLRTRLLAEETDEYYAAVASGDVVGVARELADIVYVAYGAALTHGIDLDAVIAEVHRANMSRAGDDGQPIIRPDGKVLKGPNFRPPDVAAVLSPDRTPRG